MPRPEDQLYRDIVLDHARRPRNAGRLPQAERSGSVVNPLCGDEMCVDLAFAGEKILEVRFLVRGCAIATASASMLSEQLIGLTLDEVFELERRWQKVLDNTEAELPEQLEPLVPLLSVRKFPHRQNCARLAWEALRAARPNPQEAARHEGTY